MSELRQTLGLAAHEIAAHPSVHDLKVVEEHGVTRFYFALDLGFGSRWLAAGASPTGVLPAEPVRMTFPDSFPRRAPIVSLRPDFRRDHPHVQPRLDQDRVEPCLVDGSIGEFVASRGLYALVEQLRAWLSKAAVGELMDLRQGWEPLRRDDVHDWLAVSADSLRSLAGGKGGFALFDLTYLHLDDFEFSSFYGSVGARTNAQTKYESSLSSSGKYRHGRGLALALWASRRTRQAPTVCAEYLPETVTDVASLWARAQQLGVHEELRNAVGLLRTTRSDRQAAVYPLPIVFLVRRPSHVIGSASSIELISYLCRFTMPEPVLSASDDPVRPLASLDALSPALLREVAGSREQTTWALLGCGSVGSKIALHAARSGDAPRLVADTGRMRSHNAARHGLYPADGAPVSWMGAKAELLAEACRGLAGATEAVVGDQEALVGAIRSTGKKAERPKVLLNATASIIVREDLVEAGRPKGMRLAEAVLYDRGRLAVAACEDETSNPDLCELQGQLYNAALASPGWRSLFTSDLDRVAIGQGCGSLTMPMSDARLSLMAALIADDFFDDAVTSFPPGLRAMRRTADGVDVLNLPAVPCVRTALEGLAGWSVSTPQPIAERLAAERLSYDPVETGGVLVGWSSMIARRIYVVDVLDAPEDSIRSEHEFVLGTEGLTERLEELASMTSGAVTCVGTWHSHSGSADPSLRDRRSAAMIGNAELRPMALLIRGRTSWRALSASAGVGGSCG